MGTVEFKGESPFALTLQQHATATFSGKNVQVTLPVSDGRTPPRVVEIHLTMSIESAQHLYNQLPAAIEMATKNLWAG